MNNYSPKLLNERTAPQTMDEWSNSRLTFNTDLRQIWVHSVSSFRGDIEPMYCKILNCLSQAELDTKTLEGWLHKASQSSGFIIPKSKSYLLFTLTELSTLRQQRIVYSFLVNDLGCTSFARRDSIGEIPRPPLKFFKPWQIKLRTCRNLTKSLLVTPYLLITCWNVRIEPSWVKSLTTLIPLCFQSTRPPWSPGRKSRLSWTEVNKEKQLL